ncbi:MAG: hypothetical protein P8Z49_01605 [Acidobacteriota bacterium]
MRCWAGEGDFLDLLAGQPGVADRISREDLAKEFRPENYLSHVDTLFERVFGAKN